MLGWNEKNKDPTVGVGQLETLIKTLDVMSNLTNPQCTNNNINGISSTICSMLENQWIKQSSELVTNTMNQHQYNSEVVKCLIDMAQGKYELFDHHKGKLTEIFKLRMEYLVKNFGDFKVDNLNLQTLAMFCAIKDSSFQNLKESIAWQMGSKCPSQELDHFGISSMPTNDLMGFYKSSGNFVKRKHYQLRFSQVICQLTKFVKNEDIFHLFMMSLLFDNVKTKCSQSLLSLNEIYVIFTILISLNCGEAMFAWEKLSPKICVSF